jgi:hypothetical protein
MKYFLVLALLPSAVFAADPNFLTPADLPAKAEQIFSASGRGGMPDFPDGYGIDLALRANVAHRSCMAPVGRQLTDWVTSRTTGFYWNYSVSAFFECLAPTVSITQTGGSAERLYADLKGVTEASGPTALKTADVLCYERLEDVCDQNVLMSYNERETCELADRNQNGALITLDDLNHGGQVLRQEGANALAKDLPVFVDGRRDDTSGGNCQPHLYGKFKGISRKSAHVSCTKNQDGAVECVVAGIIEE